MPDYRSPLLAPPARPAGSVLIVTIEGQAPRLPVVLSGSVVRGDGRGREIGFPTANVEMAKGAPVPPDGVYAGWVTRADGTTHVAAISVGGRPTYYGDEGEVLVEAYVLHFDDDLYGEVLEVGVEVVVRGQERFDSTEALVEQMQRDVEAVAALMASRRPPL
jgi:FAD synthase